MGKWGGYHTDFAHLARGFAGNERALAQAVGEALLESGLLAEKPSVGQRHVFLNPRRAAEIRRLIDDGELPLGHAAAVRVKRCAVWTSTSTKSRPRSRRSSSPRRRSPRPGILRPTRPDHIVGAVRALLRFGPTPAGGYTASVERYADDAAIIDELGTLTFREVHERTNALAHALQADGVGVGDSVGLMCRNHRGFIDAVIAGLQGRRQRALPQHRVLAARSWPTSPSARSPRR